MPYLWVVPCLCIEVFHRERGRATYDTEVVTSFVESRHDPVSGTEARVKYEEDDAKNGCRLRYTLITRS